MHTAEWEARCRRCGRCCYEKIEHAGRVYYSNVPCNFLDPVTRLCTVYACRHARKPECMPLDAGALSYGILPADCPYVSDRADYNAPMLWDDQN